MAVLVSLVFAGWQVRQSARQMRTGNAVVTAAAMNDGLERLHSVLFCFIEETELRPYLYRGSSHEATDA